MTDDTLLHLGYEALTAMELDLPFAVKVLTLIQTNEFLALLNLANVVSDFLVRNPTSTTTTWLLFNGLTGADRAVQIVAADANGNRQP